MNKKQPPDLAPFHREGVSESSRQDVEQEVQLEPHLRVPDQGDPRGPPRLCSGVAAGQEGRVAVLADLGIRQDTISVTIMAVMMVKMVAIVMAIIRTMTDDGDNYHDDNDNRLVIKTTIITKMQYQQQEQRQ